jgi:hypothetical protein
MAITVLVERVIDEGQLLLDRLVQDGFPVTVAFWVHTNPEGRLHLYLVTPTFDPSKIDDYYRVIISAWRAVPTKWLSIGEIQVVGPDNPAAKAVLDIQRHRSSGQPIRVHDRVALGDLAIQEAYIYPRPGGSLTPREVSARALDLMQRDVIAPSAVKLRDGSSFRGLPVGVHKDSERRFYLTFFDEDAKAERVLPAEEVVAID